MGIGMGQNLGHVPPAFVAIAGTGILLPQITSVFQQRMRELTIMALVLLAALGLNLFFRSVDSIPQPTQGSQLAQVERGKQVYISEGCIHCHSQYVRPGTADVLMWGPVESMEELHGQRPPLIGNRRQGPDLSQVGARRSRLWLKAHFYNPAQVSGSSVMPSYGFLFNDQRGDDLVAYLESLRGAGAAEHDVEERKWEPSGAAFAEANPSEGGRLYQHDCENCHSADGATCVAWQSSFTRIPRDLTTGPYSTLSLSDSPRQRMIRIAQIAKFGIPGTDMPGHEYLSDRDIASISVWRSQQMAQANHESNASLQ